MADQLKNLRARLGYGGLLAILVFFVAFPVIAQAPDAVAVWEMDIPPEGGWTVGDAIPLRLRVNAPEELSLEYAAPPAEWGDFEVLAVEDLESVSDAGTTTHLLAVETRLWSPGRHTTPAMTVTLHSAAGASYALPVTPLSVEVASVLDTDASEKHDLKPQMVLPRPPAWPWLLAVALAAPLLFLAARWLWLRRPHSMSVGFIPSGVPVDDRLPEEIAYAELARIAALDFPAQEMFKQHYTLLTDCVRVYIERVFGMPAVDRTTFELLGALRDAALSAEAYAVLRGLFEEADLVKFAKFVPQLDPARQAVQVARRFVDLSKPQRRAPEELDAELVAELSHV